METRTLCGDQAIGQTLANGNKLETSSGTHHGETHNLCDQAIGHTLATDTSRGTHMETPTHCGVRPWGAG
jgi:hypothetical protein